MCTTLRHLYRSKLLTTILNRLGQCESYDVGLELETALTKAIGEVSTKLTLQIILGDRNEVYHMEWDGASGTKQLVPGFGGFVSATGTKFCRKSTIDYFNSIYQPFTEYSVVEELLKQSEEATREVGQEYVLNTFDIGGCMTALPYVWRFLGRYQKHGPFHTGINYIGMITAHKCNGLKSSEILFEAQLVSNGCLYSVLKGKVLGE